MKTIEEKNILIGQFMGFKPKKAGDFYYWNDAPFFYCQDKTEEKVIKSRGKYAKYHSSWDWLMPVIKKMAEIETNEEPLSNVSLYSPIKLVYKEVVDFIESFQNRCPEGYPACKVYKGETVCPDENDNCSLCGGDCPDQSMNIIKTQST